MKNKSACQSVSLTLFALLVFVLCRSVALAQETAWIKDKETLAPKGTLQISGNLEMLPLATMTCNVTPTSCDNVNVSGVAMLDGRLIVNMTGRFTHSKRRTMLQANGGLMAGRFSLLKINSPRDQDLKARITYDAKHVYLEIASQSEDFPTPLPTQTAPAIRSTTQAVCDEQTSGTAFRPIVAGLSFTERVANQYAIEEVHWRHQIWPKDNPGPKPPLNIIISREQIERKVEDCLRKSQAVADQRGWAITATELQAEMDRMARDTKQPVVLHEVFAALGNDPFVIAECLARPVLAGRFAGELAKDAGVEASVSNAVTFARAGAPASQAYRLPEILDDCTDDTWTAITTVNAPQARSVRRAVWTGSEMIIWGGSNGTGLNTGGRYNPSTDTWTATSTTNAPTGRGSHTLVWTGIEVIVWGGYIQLVGDTNTGGRYNPSTDSWIVTSTVNAPHARDSHTAVWTGNEMIVWGGFSDPGVWFNSGGRYNPAADSWIATNTLAAPERRWDHTAEWTGNEMIVWGGTNQTIALNTGGKYNPATDSWTPTNTANAPLGRVAHTSIWSGSEMDVWGGYDSTITDFNTGGRYNPTQDSWTATSTLNAPSPRDYHTAVWTDREMIIWGGELITQPVSFDTGGRYDPGTDNWRATGMTNVPHARNDHTAVWTGDKMIVWGGSYWMGGNRLYLNTGGTYCAQSGPTPTPTATGTSTPTPTTTPTVTPIATATATPTAISTATATAATATPTATSAATATPTPSATPAATATATPTATPRPTPTPRTEPTPRARPTPPPRP